MQAFCINEIKGIMRFKIIFLLLYFVLAASAFCENSDFYFLSADSLAKHNEIWIAENWKYHAGDKMIWTDSQYNDTLWKVINPHIYRQDTALFDWAGIGWFRLHLQVDSSLINKPLGFKIWHAGASEIYLDGQLIYKIGTVAETKDDEIHFLERNPKVIVFKNQEHHLLAVRYSNFSFKYSLKYYNIAGFAVCICDLNKAISDRINFIRKYTAIKLVFMLIPIILALVHILLFIHYPKLKENLFYTFMLLGFAALIFFQFQIRITSNLYNISLYNRLFFVSMQFASLFGLLTTYSNLPKFPKRLLFFIFGSIFISTWLFLVLDAMVIKIALIFMFVLLVEILRVMLRFPSHDQNVLWIIRVSFFILFSSIVYQVLVGFDIIIPFLKIDYPYLYGIMFMIFAMSINLANKFASTSIDLEKQLIQVKQLSEKTLAQERQAKKQEIAQKLLEAENARKSKELEEARKLQFSMLPQNINEIAGLEICFQMKTATEVGGDYYDYHLAEDGILTIAIGDATGHGMKAGIMVSTIKSLFVSNAPHYDMVSFLDKCSQTIKKMKLGNIYMALMLAQIKDNKITLSSAGMPPVFIYRKKSKSVEELVIKGLPLGAPVTFSYQKEELRLESDDVVLLLSDGLPELFNKNKEMFDYQNIKSTFWECAEKSPSEIAQYLFRAADNWRDGSPQNDDITFVIFKKK